MKRKNTSIPTGMMHQWKRPPLSCKLCRTKKLRCNRAHPCSNCSQRNEQCVYPGREDAQAPDSATCSPFSTPKVPIPQTQPMPSTSSNNDAALLERVQCLEETVYEKSMQISHHVGAPNQVSFAPVGSNLPVGLQIHAKGVVEECRPNITCITNYLPPLSSARALFNHFASCMQPTLGVLHIPSTKALLEEIYEKRLSGREPTAPQLALVFGIFAGAAIAWTPQLLETLQINQAKAKDAFATYSHVALLILDNQDLADTSTTTLLAISTLVHVLAHTGGMSGKAEMLRMRQLVVARNLQIHRLDTPKAQQERKVKGCNIIEIEVQRRIWWHMVSTDWLLAQLTGPHEGVYFLHPKHMTVKYPTNTDDELITSSETPYDYPLNVPTFMSAFHYRIQLAQLCREVVDTLKGVLFESLEAPVSKDASYNSILALDTKIRNFMDTMPKFFKLDPVSIRESRSICQERPYIAWQRTFNQLGIHLRICRLHLPFHLEGITNPKYAYSRKMCVSSAETVLNLRRTMDEIGALVNLKPSRFWLIVQHVFLAAIMLATDVALDPNAPEANSRKDAVLAACQMLERSQHESSTLAKAIQKNTQTLLKILQNQASESDGDLILRDIAANQKSVLRASEGSNKDAHTGVAAISLGPNLQDAIAPISEDEAPLIPPESLFNQPTDEETWGQLWLDMFNAGLDSDMPQWTSLLEELEFTEFHGFR